MNYHNILIDKLNILNSIKLINNYHTKREKYYRYLYSSVVKFWSNNLNIYQL